MRNETDSSYRKLKLRAQQRHSGSDGGSTRSSTASLRVATPSMAQEAAKVRSSGTSTPNSSNVWRRQQLHADVDDAELQGHNTISHDSSCAEYRAPWSSGSLPSGCELQIENYMTPEEPQLPLTSRDGGALLRKRCMYPADSSASGCTSFTTPRSCSPATNFNSPATCMHCPDSEAKLVAARDAVVDLLSRLTQTTEERDDAVEAAQREWQLAELLRQKLAAEPDREISRLAASGGRLPPNLRSSRLGHLSPQPSPQKLLLPPCCPSLLKQPSPSPSPVRPSGFAQLSSRQVSCNGEIGMLGSSNIGPTRHSVSSRLDLRPSRSVLPPCARSLSLTPNEGLPLSSQLSAHRQRRMQQHQSLAHYASPQAGLGPGVQRSRGGICCQPSSVSPTLPQPLRNGRKRPAGSDCSSRGGTRGRNIPEFQQITPLKHSEEAISLEKQARAHDNAQARATILEQQLQQADAVILQLLAEQSPANNAGSAATLPSVGFSAAQLLPRLQRLAARAIPGSGSTSAAISPPEPSAAAKGRKSTEDYHTVVERPEQQLRGAGVLEAMLSAEELLRASRTACGATQGGQGSLASPSLLAAHATFGRRGGARRRTPTPPDCSDCCPPSGCRPDGGHNCTVLPARTASVASTRQWDRVVAGRAALRAAREDMSAAIKVLGQCRQRMSQANHSPNYSTYQH